METLTISIPDKEVKLFKELLKKFNVKIVQSQPADQKSKALKDFEIGLKQVKALSKREGKVILSAKS